MGNAIQIQELIGSESDDHLYGKRKTWERFVHNRGKSPINRCESPQDTIREFHRQGSVSTVTTILSQRAVQQEISSFVRFHGFN